MTGQAMRERQGQEAVEAPREAVVPRVADEGEGLRRQREQAAATIAQLQQASRVIRVPGDVRAEIESRIRVLDAMRQAGVPILQDRYNNEIDYISGILRQALRASDDNRSTDALRILESATAMMAFLGRIYEVELGIAIRGVPPGLENGEQTWTDLLDSMEVVLFDIGTANSRRAETVLSAGRLIFEFGTTYNVDDIAIKGELNRVVNFIIDRGVRKGTTADARAAQAYTARDARADEREIATFRRFIESASRGLGEERVALLTGWRQDLETRIGQLGAQERTRALLETLRGDIDALLVRLRNERAVRDVTDQEVREIENRYRMLSGQEPLLSSEQRQDEVRSSAVELRGTARTVREGTAEWFGQKALDALARGERELAGLAVAMGILERTAAAVRRRGSDYLPPDSYRLVMELLAARGQLTPVLASRLANDISVAALAADIARLGSENPVRGRGVARERAQRINDAVAEARRLLERGDIEGVRTLLDMSSQYAAMVSARRGRDWTGSSEMEAALDAQMRGVDSRQRFEDALTRYNFSQQTTEFRQRLEGWGRRLEQKQLAVRAIEHVESLVGQGNFQEAQSTMLRLLMFADSVELLGVRRGGKIESLNPRYDGSGMERALGAFIAGQSQVEGRGAETLFMESFASTQRNAVDLEATRLADLARTNRWTIGKDRIDAALQAARDRAAQGDFEGAFRIIRYVKQFYGEAAAAIPAQGGQPAVPARSAGWRYQLARREGAGFREGRERMLDAIRMESDATAPERREAAARMFEAATMRIAECEMLISNYAEKRSMYMGETPLASGHPAGRLLLGYAQDRTPVYIDLAIVRDYETRHARDTSLGSGPTLAQLFTQLETAANNGDVSGYNRTLEAIFGRYDEGTQGMAGGRFWLVAQRAARMQMIDSAITQLNSMGGFLGQLPNYEALPNDARRLAEIRALVDSGASKVDLAQALARNTRERQEEVAAGTLTQTRQTLETQRTSTIARLNAMRYTTEEVVTVEGGRSALDDYASLVSSMERERRISIGMAQVGEEVRLNDEYRKAIAGESGDIRNRTVGLLDECKRLLEECRTAVREGRFEDAVRLYDRAIESRGSALQTYWAENVLNFYYVSAAHRASHADRPDPRFFPALRLQQEQMEIQPYLDAHHQIFRELLFGSVSGDPQAYAERMQRRLQGTVQIEVSIFAVPSDATSQVLDDYRAEQRSVRQSVYAAWRLEDQAVRMSPGAERESLMARAQREFTDAQAQIQEMQRRAERNRFIAKVALIVVGIAAAFIPVVGPFISGGIFIGMSIDQIATEYRRDGHASAESWAMLGLTVVTLGFAGVGAAFRGLATTARTGGEAMVLAGNIARAEQLLLTASRYSSVSRAFSGTALAVGLGMSGYMEIGAYNLYRQAQRETDPVRKEALMREAVLMAGMGLFPIVHIGSSLAYRGFTAPPRARLSTALAEVSPVREAARVAAEEPVAARVRRPDGLFDLLTRLRSSDAAVRTAAEAELAALPEPVRVGIGQLAANVRVGGGPTYLNLTRALQTGELTPFARAELEGAIGMLAAEGPRPPTSPTRGPGGGGPRTTRPEVDSAGLADAFGLRQILADLLVPDGAPAQALARRSSARAMLERIRGDARTAPIADMIDNLIGNPERGIAGREAFRTAVGSDTPYELLDPFTTRALERAAGQIEGMLRPQVMRAAVGQTQPVEEAAQPQTLGGQGAAEGIGGTIPTRASAGEGGRPGAGGGEVVPGRVSPAEGGGGQ
ncbi:MAG: hypothetical protein AB1529_05685, partial [Candidatus Micrarchaeota archaeon]